MRLIEYKIGPFTLHPFRQLLTQDGPVLLGNKALAILSVLAGAKGLLVTKDELMDAVWRHVVVEENTIQVHIAALRKLLGKEAGRLVTVRGLGYRLNIDVTENAKSPGLVDHRSVAVLQFINMTGDPRMDYLGDGLSEEIINQLTAMPGLLVQSRTSSFAYKERSVDARQIGEELGVDTVLEGSVRLHDDLARVTAQLVDAQNGFHIWSQNFDSDFTNSIVLQGDLADRIVTELREQFDAEIELPVGS